MKLNEHTALQTPRLLLVPYSPHHVPTYHSWMQDEDLQTLTASSPLTLAEEYAMCTSWRTDVDKLTFIICVRPASSISPSAPTSSPTSSAPAQTPQKNAVIIPKQHDTPDTMIGDVNLFLYPYDSEDEEENQTQNDIIGELEIMIAPPSARGKGYAKEALSAFIHYITRTTTALLAEYSGDSNDEPAAGEEAKEAKGGMGRLRYLRVKINKDNVKSLGLFERMGFKRVGGGPNYFGEVELRRGIDGENEEESIFKQVPYRHNHM